MDKRKRTSRFLKNRNWKSKVSNRLRGRPEELCQDYLYGVIDRERPLHIRRNSLSEKS